MSPLMVALLNSNWICCVMRISFAVTTTSMFFFGQPGRSPPGDARRVRAEVVHVEHGVAVVVRIGAAVVVLEAVEVLGLVRGTCRRCRGCRRRRCRDRGSRRRRGSRPCPRARGRTGPWSPRCRRRRCPDRRGSRLRPRSRCTFSGSFGHLSTLSRMPSPSLSPTRGVTKPRAAHRSGGLFASAAWAFGSARSTCFTAFEYWP